MDNIQENNTTEKWLYVMIIEKTPLYKKMTKAIVIEHIENIRKLDDQRKLELCGVFKKYPGVAGMFILKTQSFEEAEEICKGEPLVVGGFATYKLYPLQVAEKDNNYLL